MCIINKRKLVWIRNNLLGIMLCLVLLLFCANLCLIFLPYSKEARGTFGDQFGAVNALFSGLAFAGLIYTIMLQRKDLKLQRQDLKLQRKELELTRKEMEEQTAEYEKQNETLKIQQFENTFFNMLSQFQEVVNNLSYTGQDGIKVVGREIFKYTFVEVPLHSNIKSDNPFLDQQYIGIEGILTYLGWKGYMESDIPTYYDHYFRLFYRILKFVKTSKELSNYESEYRYTSILRALLSRYELLWIYYNGLSDYGEEKLKPLIERYAMLKNMRDDLPIAVKEDLGSYANSAFMKTIPEE